MVEERDGVLGSSAAVRLASENEWRRLRAQFPFVRARLATHPDLDEVFARFGDARRYPRFVKARWTDGGETPVLRVAGHYNPAFSYKMRSRVTRL